MILRDDGCGLPFDPALNKEVDEAAAIHGGRGLKNMQCRAAQARLALEFRHREGASGLETRLGVPLE